MSEVSDDKALHIAVMEAMWPLPCVNPSYCTREELDRERERCEKWRTWISQADLANDVRYHYLEWVRYCEHQNARGEHELVAQTRQKRQLEYEQRQAELGRKVAAITIPKPDVRI